MGGVEPFDDAGQPPHQRVGMFAQVVLGTGGVQAPLRIEHVLAPGLVEADRDIVAAVATALAGSAGRRSTA